MSFTLAGSVLLLLAFWLFVGFSGLFAPGLVCFTLGAIALILGVSKLAEPEVSFELSADELLFLHRKGQLSVGWDNIQRLDVVRVTQGMEMAELPYIGVKLKQLNPVLDAISPRLATGIVSEQRPLLMTAAAQLDELDTLEHQLSAEFTPLVINGERYRGVLAMFGHRCELLNLALGYHIYLPVDSLDRAPRDFVCLLRGYL
ncbi:MAG: DUF2982 domain-containing protein [Shewanella sp.]|nr:DUF2982 domain-containing protein [Shewanella sp.]